MTERVLISGDCTERVVVNGDRVDVISVGIMGPAGPPSLSAGAIITAPGDLIVGDESGVGERFPLASQPIYNVRLPQFGAAGNGTTDDRAAIQAAIDAAELVRGIVVFPPGQYRITAPLVVDTQGVTLRGAGRNGTLASAAIGTAIVQVTANTDVLQVKADGITVEDLQLNGTGSGTGRGLVIDTGVAGPPTQFGVTVRRVRVRTCGGDGVVALKPEQLHLESVLAIDNGGKGILIDSSGASLPTNPLLVNCRAQSNLGTHQIHLKDAHYPVLLNCQALAGTAGNANCRFQNCSGLSVVGGDFEAGGASGIQVSGTTGSIRDALFASVTTGISCTTWTDGTIEGCRFPSSLTTSINVDAGSRIAIGFGQDAATGGMTWAAGGEVSLARKRQVLAYAASFSPNPTLGEYVEVGALTGSIGVSTTTKHAKGARLTFRFLQDGTGGRAVTWNAVYKHAWSDTGNTANKQSTISFAYDGSSWVQQGAQSPYV
jgi:Pectate lyase superfamily protein/Right handed beta helix region